MCQACVNKQRQIPKPTVFADQVREAEAAARFSQRPQPPIDRNADGEAIAIAQMTGAVRFDEQGDRDEKRRRGLVK